MKHKRFKTALFLGTLLLLLTGKTAIPVNAEKTNEESDKTTLESFTVRYNPANEEDDSRKMAAVGQEFNIEDTKLTITDEMDLKKEKPKEYTLMVYLLGSNLESRFGNATKDLSEMIDAGVDPEKVNILVYTGGSRRWLTGIPCDRNCVLELNGSNDLPVVAETEHNGDMGAPETLTEFLKFCNTYYPAEHNALIFWDHGGGPLMGFGSDELFNQDSLLLSEMKSAMKKSPYSRKNKLDWVGFDACLMGSLESMKVWSEYAKYYVASEELEPGPGWDYTALSVLNETSDPVEITTTLVDGFRDYYEEAYELDYRPDLTLAVSDLSKVEKVEKALDALSDKMKKSAAGSGYSQLQQARRDSKAFGLADFQEDVDEESLDLVDLIDFTGRVESFYPGKGEKLLNELDKLVVHSYANMEHAHGVSFYYPYRNKVMYQKWKSVSDSVSVTGGFRQFLKTLTAKWLSGRSKDWNLNWEEEHADGYSVQLTEEQMEDAAAVYYTILERDETYAYRPILEKVRVYPDDDGRVTVPRNPELLCLKSEEGEETPWTAIQLEAQDDADVYATQKTSLFTDSNVLSYLDLSVCMSEYLSCTVTLASEKDEDGAYTDKTLQIRNVSEKNEKEGLSSGKNTLDLSHYECIYNSYGLTYPSVDEKGNTRPYKEWPESGVVQFNYCELKEQPEYVWKSCSEFSGEYAVQLILEDTTGELYATDLMDLTWTDADEHPEELTISTEKGECVYRISKDFAILDDYTGNDAVLEIPGFVTMEDGREFPVTEIGYGVFSNARTLKKITLPDSIAAIRDDAFKQSGIEAIQLPSGLQSIGKNAFSLCFDLKNLDLPSSLIHLGEAFVSSSKGLEAITLDGASDGSCEACKLIDGTVYSADGKVLMAYPAAREGSCKVAKGTEEIGYGAFTRSAVTEVKLPKGLIRIGVSAFAGCRNLIMPKLPDSLESIEAHAFGAYSADLILKNEPQEAVTVKIGSKLSYVGQGAFDRLPSRVFTVSEENAFFSSVEGHLCNRAGDTLRVPAMDGTGTISIPSGICILDAEVFTFLNSVDSFADDYDDSVDVELPVSVARLEGDWPSIMPDEIFHVEAGSEAERYAWKNGVDYNYNFDRDSEEYHTLIEAEQAHTIEIDGFVYDEDGTTLLKAPEDITKAVIPKGTVEIGERAFFLCKDLKKVVFPEGLLRIDSSAFYGCDALEEIAFPESLEELGYGVFSGSDKPIPVKGGVLRIGENFTKVSSGCFFGLAFDSFEVSENNPSFSVVQGMLCDKAGSILYAVPANLEGRVEIPDGIVVVRADAVKTVAYACKGEERMEKITEITVPASVQYIHRLAFPNDYKEGYLVTLYVKKGSYGQKYAKQYNIPVKTSE